jgi:hypothetical protein
MVGVVEHKWLRSILPLEHEQRRTKMGDLRGIVQEIGHDAAAISGAIRAEETAAVVGT